MSVVEIPITNQPNQSFDITLPGDSRNVILSFYVYWNRVAGYWQANITDVSKGTEVITGLPLLRSEGFHQNLLAQWAYLGIGQLFVLPTSVDKTGSPGLDDWGSNFVLIWGP